MAQVACARLLDVPSLVHLDRVLALLGRKTRKSRPDFLGVDPVTHTYSVALEAKGRTHGRSDTAIAKAKHQSARLPNVSGVTSTMNLATMSYFSAAGSQHEWRWHLEDPPPRSKGASISREALIALHYEPIIRAVENLELEDAGRYKRVLLPDLDAWLWIQSDIVGAFYELSPTAELGDFEDVGYSIANVILAPDPSPPRQELDESADRRTETGQFFMGRNQIGLELGDSWFDASLARRRS